MEKIFTRLKDELAEAIRAQRRSGDNLLRLLCRRDTLRDALRGREGRPADLERQAILRDGLETINASLEALTHDLDAGAERLADIDRRLAAARCQPSLFGESA